MSGDSHKTKYSLIERALDLSDEGAWQELFNHYSKFIHHVLHKAGIDIGEHGDISQEVLVQLTKSLPKYDREKGKFRSWLGHVILNVAYTHGRKIQAHQRKLSALESSQEQGSGILPANLDQIIDREWELYVTNLALSRVKDSFRGKAITVFTLGLEGKTTKEIQEITKLTEDSVYSLKQRVKKRMRAEVQSIIADLEF